MQDSIRVGIAGLGTVGSGVAKILLSNGHLIQSRCSRKIELTAISSKSKSKKRGFPVEKFHWEENLINLARRDDIDIFVELIGGEGNPAKEAIEAALNNGKHVVTANKALMAKHGHQLAKLAENNGLSLKFEAAVAGGIPAIKT